MEHSFNIDVAKEYGAFEAIILKFLYFWIQKNRANEKHFHDGRYWTYNSMNAFKELFPYMTENQIRRVLKHLESEGLMLTGNFNKSTYDRTKWYALTDKATSILQKAQMETSKKQNGSGENHEPIPVNIPVKETDNNTPLTPQRGKRFIPPTVDEVKAYCLDRQNGIDAQTFVDFYESKGWMIGKSKMKDWKAAVRTWERNRKGSQQSTGNPYIDMLKEGRF